MLCPTPFKQRFALRRDARMALADIVARPGRKPGVVYECRCGGFHLASGRWNSPRLLEARATHDLEEVDDWLAEVDGVRPNVTGLLRRR